MENLKENFKILRERAGKTQASISIELGFSRGVWNMYESGKSKPSIDDLVKISKYFGLSPGELLDGYFENVHLNEKNKDSKFQKNVHPNVHPNVHLSGVKTPKTHAINSLIVAEDEANYEVKSRGNVYDFDSQAAAGMAMYLSQKDKLIQVPTLNLPGLGPGLHIRCQVSGDSMHGTIKDGDHVIATQLKSPADELREGFIHVVFDKDDGIVCKRLYKADKHHLELVSDNDIYTPYKRHLNDLLFIFKVVEVHTRDLRNYFNDTRREVSKLWKAIEDINARLPKLK